MPKSMINTCCNLYFYYNFIVHGIRHLENRILKLQQSRLFMAIRHLEISACSQASRGAVHGGIRHLEIPQLRDLVVLKVHGAPFRKFILEAIERYLVHGDTPFRNYENHH